LTIDAALMPTALAWQKQTPFPAQGDPRLVVASLEGRVWAVEDTDGDGREDAARPISHELATPYGIIADGSHIDVATKSSLLRLQDDDGDGLPERAITLASGWGHTDDYHDWAVGIAPAGENRYFLALPCQQDNRSPAAARFRGNVLDVRFDIRSRGFRYERAADLSSLETISTGHRFPMGMARNKAGDLFVTDNQGNYNPFNELNHVRPGKDFGFVNANDKKKARSPLTPPAINIPHPWTRSVNGICFLETPATVGGGRRCPGEM
jgi:glucose/arabinose dehydrogenase